MTYLATASNTLTGYFFNSNFAGQLIVLLLLGFSLIAWTLMIGKYLELKRLGDLNALFVKNKSPAGILSTDLKSPPASGPFGLLAQTAVAAVYKFRSGVPSHFLTAHIESALTREVSRICNVYESKMPMLGSIVSGAPFLGLLGTVWGVMDAFGGLALQGNASIQALAPGVSGALLTTVAGLLVAIPSVFGYNYLVSKTKSMIVDLENYASQLADELEIQTLCQETSAAKSA